MIIIKQDIKKKNYKQQKKQQQKACIFFLMKINHLRKRNQKQKKKTSKIFSQILNSLTVIKSDWFERANKFFLILLIIIITNIHTYRYTEYKKKSN